MTNPNFESLQDNALDIMGYGLIACLLIEDKWESATESTTLERLNKLNETFWRKRIDYGIEDITIAGIEGVLTRLQDKISRLKNLTKIETTQPKLLLKKLVDCEGLRAPALNGDCGYDIVVAEDIIIPSRETTQLPIDVPSKCCVKIPSGYWGMIINRSSAARKYGVAVVHGVIDEGYVGELFSCVYNLDNKERELKAGDRIAQLILLPKFTPPVHEVTELPITERGQRGFGSTSNQK